MKLFLPSYISLNTVHKNFCYFILLVALSGGDEAAAQQAQPVRRPRQAVSRGQDVSVPRARVDQQADIDRPGHVFGAGLAHEVEFACKENEYPVVPVLEVVQGMQRVKLGSFVAEQPYMVARISEMPDVAEPSPELEALSRNVQRTFSEIIEQIPYLPEELQLAVTNIEDPSALTHLIAGALRIATSEKQEMSKARRSWSLLVS